MNPPPRVALLQYRLLHYRVQLFEQLRQACAARGIELVLVHGQATRREQVKRDEGRLDWARVVRNRVWEIGERDWIWQPLPPAARDAALVVTMQENRILSNYPLLLSRLWRRRKVAYWGHGRNFQSVAPTGWRERWKSLMLCRVDWWFSYTAATTAILEQAGYPRERITQLDNAIDSDGFKADLAAWSEAEIRAGRVALGLPDGAPTAVFCGSLYPDKRLDLLIDVADRIRAQLPGFTLIVIGDGPSMPLLREAANSRPWLHLTGVRTGRDKARLFRMADVMLNPGLVGLHIVDAFCAGLVMVTTDNARHSPEVAYLEHGRNGLMLTDDPARHAAAVVALLQDAPRLQAMREQALADSARYTLARMVEHFADGIERALRA
ncbi:glycosyltransferase family 4 protein [Leptothrix sp. BB-4]